MTAPADSQHDHAHDTAHDHEGQHDHVHGVVDPGLLSSQRGIWAVKWSLVGLFATALFQLGVVALTGSVALLADTIHNFGDALTAIPLWIAFQAGKRPPNRRYTYGYGRLEDLAGLTVVLMILITGVLAATESIRRFFDPQPVEYIGVVAAAALIGFLGNEAVALFRLRVGRQIGSAALIADGLHARADGLTSLAVLAGAIGVWLGFPLADPLAGLVISLAILRVLIESGRAVFTRLLDAVDPEIVDEIEEASAHTPGVEQVNDVRVRWLGHRLRAEVCITVGSQLSVGQGHGIANEVRHNLLHTLEYLSDAIVHVDPLEAPGSEHHTIQAHQHDDLAEHNHP